MPHNDSVYCKNLIGINVAFVTEENFQETVTYQCKFEEHFHRVPLTVLGLFVSSSFSFTSFLSYRLSAPVSLSKISTYSFAGEV